MFHRILLAFAIMAATAAGAARAETAEERKACLEDAQNYCPDEMPDREKVYQCLVKKVDQISAPCRKIINDSLSVSLTPSKPAPARKK